MFSPSEENYIKAIYHLQTSSRSVSTNALAEKMQTKPASVTDMLKKLKAKELLDYEPYYGVKLTPTGRKVALNIIRRHRLWEFFLVNTIGFEWDKVHEIAEELEHVQHPLLIEKLDEFLGRPAFDPHGDPIPDREGKIASTNYRMLTDAVSGEMVLFASVGLQTPELMDMLRHKNLSLGDRIEVLNKFDFDQSLDIIINDQQNVSLSYRLARYILITP
ncbi:MAG: metal-dependent transcriptional regulator [Chitinophagaceae bacterium]|nr:metal-dependent transcriptional regulator [Chitinophagaceae bacterium]